MDPQYAFAAGSRVDVKKLAELEITLVGLAASFKLEMKPTPKSSFDHLARSSADLVQNITREVASLADTLVVCAKENINPRDDREFFVLSMRRMGLTYPSDFLDHIKEGDVIEGYDMDRRQIFRNLTFMQKSGYSLIDMLSFEWTTLFDRSQVITNKMTSYCDEILWKENRTIPFNIPKHFTRERQSNERIMHEVQFRYLTPLFSGPNNPFGILGSCICEPVEASNPIDKLSFV